MWPTLKSLSKGDITEIKVMKKPPDAVKLVMEAVCIMQHVKPEKIKNPNGDKPAKIDDYWGPSQKMLNDLGPDKFKQALIDFDKENIPEKVINKILDLVTVWLAQVVVRGPQRRLQRCGAAHACQRNTEVARLQRRRIGRWKVRLVGDECGIVATAS